MGGSESKPSSDSSTDREEEVVLNESKIKSALKASAIAVGTVAVVVAIAVAGAAVVRGIARIDKRMMKAPGRNGESILRSVFEGDPKGYFRNLRNKD
ncbi:uncharacterized protein M6B38_123190 [Iris pallida]|uniref:Uncharacterized protein n=1 Tax=Iris pallida TaxID=29817 RepID=A0AAX6H288_IRIPA|nr:hypothetical protein M6B38_142470 [Iris pallida]KAJ6827130.1 hypothetical protein M6B38_367785 [Iris pallida]KAJ6834923.1 hypothetical protein M6B38_123040 [Iris pallida]KAJ6834953.1 uncharacterized protein M6B38_123190 [Iris pallida]